MNKKILVVVGAIVVVCLCVTLVGAVAGLVVLNSSSGAPTFSSSSSSSRASSSASSSAASTGAKLLDATFTHKFTDNYAPTDATTEFKPTDTVNLSLRFEGRPKAGVIKTQFFLSDQLIAEAQTDFAEANSDVLFSVGQVTYAGFYLKPNKPFPASDKYHADVFLNDKLLASYKFKVLAP